MTEPCTFAEFHQAVHSRPPLPWQDRLAQRVRDRGWNADDGILTIGVETGLGKTTCIDIAVWALAMDALNKPDERKLPRRIWYVVDRRLLVDEATARGERLAEVLEDDDLGRATSGPIAEVRGLLAGLGGRGETALHVAALRGGVALGDRPPDPAQPTLILATPAMFASRWLFSGYGSSRSLRPVDAALAGTDSLVLLDEAHLSAALVETHAMVRACDAASDPVLPPTRRGVTLVALTATAAAVGERFTLNDDDFACGLVRRRLDAVKRTRLAAPTNEKQVARVLADEADAWLGEAEPNGACLVFANRPATARAAFERLRDKGGAEVLLLTGRMREPEAQVVRTKVLDWCRAGTDRSQREHPVVVVATQTLEVGADLDVDHLVTETAGVRSLVQRFGRLNRFGSRTGTAVVVHGGGAKLYEAESDLVWERLQMAAADLGEIDLSPSRIAGILGKPLDAQAPAPELLPTHLWEWAKTSEPVPNAAPVEAFFAPGEGELLPVSIAWRAGLHTEWANHQDSSGEGEGAGPDDEESGMRLWPAISADETVDIWLGQAREGLGPVAASTFVVQRDGGTAKPATHREDGSLNLRPGQIVVVDAMAGCYDEWGWAPDSKLPVTDVRMRSGAALPLHEPLIQDLLNQAGVDDQARDRLVERLRTLYEADADGDADQLEVGAWKLLHGPGKTGGEGERDLNLVDALTGAPSWLDSLAGRLSGAARKGLTSLPDGTLLLPLPRVSRRQRSAPVRVDAFEELSFLGHGGSKDLVGHLEEVGHASRELAEGLGIDPALARACCLAGKLHDAGKADPRFQRWLAREPGGSPLAKSSFGFAVSEVRRSASGWPRAGRHELLSLRLAERWIERVDASLDADLVLHLIASHHGWGRPSFRPVADPTPPPEVRWTADGVEVACSADLSVIEADQPRRFRRLCERYGLWGLALLEAVVRQSDHALSGMAASNADNGSEKKR